MPPPAPFLSDPPARCFVLIPSAGVGERAKSPSQPDLPKQYQMLNGQPVIAHTLAAFAALGDALAGVAVVISSLDKVLSDLLPDLVDQGVTLLGCGGATRADSVRQGLQAWMTQPHGPQAHDWVLVHDAARCLLRPTHVQALIAACRDDPVGGLLALPLPDTLKVSDTGRVARTLERADKWLAQTPQMFRAGMLLDALKAAASQGLPITDEASALEAQGLSPKLVPGSAQNFKITYPEDFSLAEAVLRVCAQD